MGSAWDKAKQMAERHAGAGGMFIRLANDGDTVVGAFSGEPEAREVHWTGETYVECTGPGCAQCGAGVKATMRVTINFWVASENAMKVMEGGIQWFRDVLTVQAKYGLEKWTYEVKRVGKPKDPKTKYVILPEAPIDDATRKKIAACALHDLQAIGRGDAYEADNTASAAVAPPAEATIDVTAANELLLVLKTLPKAEVDVFFRMFKIERLRELRAASLPDARAYLARVAGMRSGEVPF